MGCSTRGESCKGKARTVAQYEGVKLRSNVTGRRKVAGQDRLEPPSYRNAANLSDMPFD
jgi:hypothetical protein